MRLIFLLLLLFAMSAPSIGRAAAPHPETPYVVTSAIRNQPKGILVISMQYYVQKSTRRCIHEKGAWLEIDGVKYPIRADDSMRCGSHTGMDNVTEEFIVDLRPRPNGAFPIIPNIEKVKAVLFILDRTVNGKSMHVRKELPVVDITTPVTRSKNNNEPRG